MGASQGLTQTQMQALAQNYFDANYTAGNSFGVPAPVSIAFGNQQVSLSASVEIPTTLMNIVGIKTMDVSHTSKIVWGQTKLWVGLVLDNTGSMNESDSSGSKIDALKSATHSLLTMLQNASSTPGDVKASIIPFSKDINFGAGAVGDSWIDWSDWLAPPANSMPSASVGPGSSCPYSSWSNGFGCTQGPANGSWNTNTIPSSGTYAGYICPSRDNGRVDPGRNGHYYNGCYDSVPAGTTTTSCVTPWGGSTSCTTTTSSDPYTGSIATSCNYDSHYTKTCITRTGAPYTHNWVANDKSTWDGCFMDRAQSYDEQNDPATGGSTDFPAENASSCPPAQIAPLSYDWTALNSEVNSMTPNGNTNQTIGLAWGWQSLTDGDPMNAGTLPPQTQRVIILLSDGVNTQNRWTQRSVVDRCARRAGLRQCQSGRRDHLHGVRGSQRHLRQFRGAAILRLGLDQIFRSDDVGRDRDGLHHHRSADHQSARGEVGIIPSRCALADSMCKGMRVRRLQCRRTRFDRWSVCLSAYCALLASAAALPVS